MKKIIFMVLYIMTIPYQIYSASKKNSGGHYVFNFTGRTLRINFYKKILGKAILTDSVSIKPLLLGGKQPNDFLNSINATFLPETVDMHELTSDSMIFYVQKLGDLTCLGDGCIDKSFKNIKVPSPAMELMLHDYKVELEDNQLIVTRLNTVGGIQIPGTKKSDIQIWPKPEPCQKGTLAERISCLETNNKNLQKKENNIEQEVKKWRKAGNVTKLKNRKNLRDDIDKQIQKNNNNIATLKKQQATQILIQDTNNDETNNTSLDKN